MKYFVSIETLQVVEVNSNSEEEAIEIVKNQLEAQKIRDVINLKIAKEMEV